VALQLAGRLDLSKLIPAISTSAYESVISTHGLIMFFFCGYPGITGLMNYLIPLLIGARDMAFPRLNANLVLAAASGSSAGNVQSCRRRI